MVVVWSGEEEETKGKLRKTADSGLVLAPNPLFSPELILWHRPVVFVTNSDCRDPTELLLDLRADQFD